MKKTYTAIAAVLFCAGLSAQNTVTIQVDMTGQTVGANGVHVAGNFQMAAGFPGDWDPSTTALTQVGSTSIYSTTVTLPSGTYEYKFVNGNAWGSDESVPAESGIEPSNGNYNRFMIISSDTTLPAVAYAGNNPAGLVLMRFGVDLTLQAGVSANGVHVAGNFQAAAGFPGDWDPATTELFQVATGNTGLYERIVYVPAGTYQYKYINGDTWTDNESVPGACNVGGNREVVLSAATNLGPMCFNLCTACPSNIPQYDLTFEVDMNNYASCNNVDSVTVAGTINGWAGTTMDDSDGDGIYTLTLTVDSGEVEFKFRAHDNGNTNWEGVPNRVYTHSSLGTYSACFNVEGNGGNCTPIPAPSDITFRVDLTNEVPAANVYVMGDFTTPTWQTGAIELDPVAGSPGIYEKTVNGICAGTIYYKFTNGDPNSTEETFPNTDSSCVVPSGVGGFNRVYVRTSAAPVTLSWVFNTCNGGPIGVEDFGSREIVLSPNPMSSYSEINLGEGDFSGKVMDLTGKTVRDLGAMSGTVRIERGGLSSGIYLLQIANERGEINTSKLVVQ